MKPLLVLASIIVVMAGLKAAVVVVVPLLLAIFMTIIFVPPVSYLESKKVPGGFAIAIVLTAGLGGGFLLMGYLGAALTGFTKSLPDYEAALSERMESTVQFFQGYGIDVSAQGIGGYFDPSFVVTMVSTVFSSLSEILANFFLIVLTVVFMLLETSNLPRKMRVAFGGSEATAAISNFSKIATGVNKYLAIKSMISVVTGLTITVWLAILGVDYPILWGVLAFMLNYVPNIGSLIAAVPAVVLALIQADWVLATLVGAGYFAVNIVMGNVIEPRVMGRGVGLSTLVVFLSLVFWGWILGPVGMLLSVPLTMVAKISCESNEATRWIGVMLGPDQAEILLKKPIIPTKPRKVIV